MTAYLVDTETTRKKDVEVIELACLELLPPCEGGSFFVQRYEPKGPIEWGAMAVHHIIPEDLHGMPPSTQAKSDLPRMTYMIGHNIDFDWQALGKPAVKRICTLALARNLWPKQDSHSLTACVYAHSELKASARERLRNAHSAEADVRNNHWLLHLIMTELGVDSWDALWEASELARIPTVMTFGKFMGQPIQAVDRGYAMWYNKQPDPDPYLIQAFRKVGLLK